MPRFSKGPYTLPTEHAPHSPFQAIGRPPISSGSPLTDTLRHTDRPLRPPPEFSPREQQILEFTRQGLTDSAIATRLKISESTVATYWARIRSKVGPLGRTEIVVAMIEQERERELAGLFAHAADGIAYVGLDGSILKCNDRWNELFGAAVTDLAGFHLREIEERAHLAPGAVWDPFQKLLQERLERTSVDLLLGPDGHDGHPVTLRLLAVRDVQGVPKHAVAIAEDAAEKDELGKELNRERSFSALVLQTLAALVVVLDREGRIVGFNRACEEATGYTYDEVRGIPFWDILLTPADKGPVEEIFKDLLYKALPNHFENAWVTKDGRLRTIAWSNSSLMDEDNAVGHIIATGIDVTDQRAAVQATAVADERYRAVFENALEGILVATPRNEVVDANPEACRILGLEASQIIGRSTWTLLEFESDALRDAAQREVDTCGRWKGELLLNRADGTKSYQEWSVHQHEMPGHRVAIFRDVTHRRRTQADLQDALSQLESIMNASLDPMITIDPNGVIQSANRATAGVLGYAAEALIGRNVEILMSASDAKAHRSHLRKRSKATTHGIVCSAREVLAIKSDGTSIPVELTVTGCEYSGKPAYLGVIHDISLRKRSENELKDRASQLQSAINDLENVAYHISHEMRPPLRSILAAHHDLVSTTRSQEANLEHIREVTMLLSDLIDDVLQYIHVRRSAIARIKLDLSKQARTIAARLSYRFPNARFSVEDNLTANGDRGLITLALEELFENALRHCGRDDPTIEVASHLDREVAVYCVRDDGKGFPIKYLEKVFQPFEVLERRSGRRGTGIGLAVVKEIIERHGGRIWADSKPGGGASFCFTLEPLPQPADG